MRRNRNNEEDALERAERAAARRRTPGEYAGLAARGFCMGAADVVPGVSGGTMAFILGIYEELIASIREVGQPEFLRAAVRFRIREVFEILNWKFLLAVLTGIVAAILTLARGLEWMLENRPTMVWSFFFGLVFASVLVVARRIERWRPALWVALMAGAVFAYLLVGLVPLQTPDAAWFLFLSGAIAICAMILPGISGAFILVLLGKYQYVLSAVNQRDLLTIFWVGAGAAVGIVTFAQILGWLFRRYHDATVAVLTGLMMGSLRKVWPWKVDLEWMIGRHGERIPTVQRNVLPDAFTSDVMTAIILGITGFALVLLLDWWAGRLRPEMKPGS
jgi:putative membrane protein